MKKGWPFSWQTADSSLSAGSEWQQRGRQQNQLGTAGEDDINTMETLRTNEIITIILQITSNHFPIISSY